MIGKLIKFEKQQNSIILQFEKKTGVVELIESGIVRFYLPNSEIVRNSNAVVIEKNNEVKCDIRFKGQELRIKTDKLLICVYPQFKVDIYDRDGNVLCEDYRGKKEPFVRRSGDFALAAEEGHDIAKTDEHNVYVSKVLDKDMHFYGMGEKTGHLDKRDYHYVNWNTDDPSPHGETFDRLYKSIPFFINFREDKTFGIFFDNTFKSTFDFGRDNKDYYYFSSVDGDIDYYFIYGPKIKDVVTGYTRLTGTTPLPQLWTLGYQQCRWSYDSIDRVWEVADNFRNRDIPCDTIYLDIDYMDGYRVFTHDKERFKNFKENMDKLKEKGFKVITIIDPGVKKDDEYSVYKQGLENGYFAKDKNGNVYVNKVWPGDSVYPNFLDEKVRKWWGENHRVMNDLGVSGIWNDMNEPASFVGPLPDDVQFGDGKRIIEHKEAHNVYGFEMCRATYEGLKNIENKRPFVLTRAAYSGIQRYSAGWTGDNQSTWEHLRMSVPMLMNMGLSGIAYCGTDVGGFSHDCSKELLSRWVQVGAFTPLFRNHAAMGTRDQEPWAFDEETEDINRKYIKLRYKMLPYLYDAFKNTERTGLPILKPLVINYEEDSNTYEINNEFMFGDNILVAPVLEQGVNKKLVYLPKGDSWVDYWTKEKFEGGQYIIKDAPLDICPIYVKSMSIMPCYEEMNYIGEKEINKIVLEIYATNNEGDIVYNHYHDDGETFNYKKGIYDEYKIKASRKNESLEISVEKIHEGYEKSYREIEFKIVNSNDEIKDIKFNGINIEADSSDNILRFIAAV